MALGTTILEAALLPFIHGDASNIDAANTQAEAYRRVGVVERHRLIDMTPRMGATDLDDYGRMIRVNDEDVLRANDAARAAGSPGEDAGELVVRVAAVWTYPSTGPRSMAYLGSNLNPDNYVAVVMMKGDGVVCSNCGLRLGMHTVPESHRATRSCLTAPMRRELAALGYIHCDGEPQVERLRALGVPVRVEDTALIGYMTGGEAPVYVPDAWAPAWAVVLDRRDLGLHVNVAAWAIRRAATDETFRAAVDTVYRSAGAHALRDFVYAQPGAEQAWRGGDRAPA